MDSLAKLPWTQIVLIVAVGLVFFAGLIIMGLQKIGLLKMPSNDKQKRSKKVVDHCPDPRCRKILAETIDTVAKEQKDTHDELIAIRTNQEGVMRRLDNVELELKEVVKGVARIEGHILRNSKT